MSGHPGTRPGDANWAHAGQVSQQAREALDPPRVAATAVVLLLLLVFAWGPNIWLSAFALLVLVLGFVLLYRPGEPPVMLLVFGLQWLQASVKTLQANLQDVPLRDLSQFENDIVTSSGLSMLALLVLAAGMRLAAGPPRPIDGWRARTTVLQAPPSAWFRLYLTAFILSLLVAELAYVVRGLSQPLLALAQLKWAFFFMLVVAVLVRPAGGRALWLAAVGLELAVALGGYFADFKTVFFVSILGALAAGVRLTVLRAALLAGLLGVLLTFAITWTAVKGDYRHFVSGGQTQQVVEKDFQERLAYLTELVQAIDRAKWDTATENFLSRVSYVDFFGAVLDYVPAAVPHTRGEIWLDALVRPFMPRMFFPGKTAIEDSERTAMFTGLQVAGADRGTSISIGYIGESYIDFGAFGMFLPVFAIGLLLGAVYRWLVSTGSMAGLVGTGLAIPSLLSFAFLESSITKVFGGFVAMLLVLWMFGKFIAPRLPAWTRLPPYTLVAAWSSGHAQPMPNQGASSEPGP